MSGGGKRIFGSFQRFSFLPSPAKEGDKMEKIKTGWGKVKTAYKLKYHGNAKYGFSTVEPMEIPPEYFEKARKLLSLG